ncbi:MAG: N-acetyltransferase [Alphaproteobacteria bacterium]|nr:N-acetyltransferase [Alphaproteobacteria bacterium]
MVTIRAELSSDIAAREALLNQAFGVKRLRKTSEKLRAGRVPALAFSAIDERGKVIGTIRLWNIIAGSAGQSLLLGPIAVDAKHQKSGIGRALMETAIFAARDIGAESILLVGDEPYYSRFGFSASLTRSLHLPGPVERARFLGLELEAEALDGAEGMVMASGALTESLAAAA